MWTTQPRVSSASRQRGPYVRMSIEKKTNQCIYIYKKMTEPSKINSFQKHLKMKVVSYKIQENCRPLLVVTEQNCFCAASYVRMGLGSEKKAIE